MQFSTGWLARWIFQLDLVGPVKGDPTKPAVGLEMSNQARRYGL
jgi:hypothetical protein